MVAVRARELVRRRAARVAVDVEDAARRQALAALLRPARRAKAHRLCDQALLLGRDQGCESPAPAPDAAGIYDPRAAAVFLSRPHRRWPSAWCDGVFRGADVRLGGQDLVLALSCAGQYVVGYLAPSFYLDRRIAKKRLEHMAGFPDFMDLLVVCADAGLSMEASLDRVGRELGDSYPSLAANIHMANLEIRAGRTMSEALEHLGDRLGLDEARSFATLIQQSDELGSSIGDALRVYSDDMRHKRLSRAEEKAYALPAKLSVPMMVCIFPTLFVVILLPVIVRMVTHNW